MTSNKLQRRAKKPSNKGSLDKPNYGGRATLDTHSRSPQADSGSANKRAVLAAEKALRKVQKDRDDRLKKHEVVDATQYPASPFVVLRVSSNRLENLGYPAAEKLWGTHARALGLPRDWVKREQDLVGSETNIVVGEDVGVSTDRPISSRDNDDKRTNPEGSITASAQQEDITFTNPPVSPSVLSHLHASPRAVQNTTAICSPASYHISTSASLPQRHQVSSSVIHNHLAFQPGSSRGHESTQPIFASNHIRNSKHLLPLHSPRRENNTAQREHTGNLGTPCQHVVQQSSEVDEEDSGANLPSSERTSLVVELKIPDGFKLNENMAPVRDPQSVHGSLKEVVQNLFEVQTQVHGFVNETQPLLIDKMTELAHSLGHLQDLTSATISPNNPIHQTRIAPEIIDYVDDGRNPDIFTRDFVELVSRGNAVINGKQQAFRDFSQVFADALKNGIEGIDKEVDLIMKNADGKKEEQPKVETQGNGAVRL